MAQDEAPRDVQRSVDNHAPQARDVGSPAEPTQEKTLRRRKAFGSMLLPFAALLSGCTTQKTQNAMARLKKLDFDDEPGATHMEPDGTRTFRNHELVDQDGNVVRFNDDLIRGKVFAATFMYVQCKGICLDMTTHMAGAYDLLKPVMDNPVQFYSFSLAEDSPEDLKQYMIDHGIYGRPGWRYFSGPKSAIKDIRWAFGFFERDEELDGNLNGHTGMARFGNHRIDKWSSCPALGNPLLTARSMLAVIPPDRRPRVPGVDREPDATSRQIPNYQPRKPLGGQPL
jgi:protein SCO1/2